MNSLTWRFVLHAWHSKGVPSEDLGRLDRVYGSDVKPSVATLIDTAFKEKTVDLRATFLRAFWEQHKDLVRTEDGGVIGYAVGGGTKLRRGSLRCDAMDCPKSRLGMMETLYVTDLNPDTREIEGIVTGGSAITYLFPGKTYAELLDAIGIAPLSLKWGGGLKVQKIDSRSVSSDVYAETWGVG